MCCYAPLTQSKLLREKNPTMMGRHRAKDQKKYCTENSEGALFSTGVRPLPKKRPRIFSPFSTRTCHSSGVSAFCLTAASYFKSCHRPGEHRSNARTQCSRLFRPRQVLPAVQGRGAPAEKRCCCSAPRPVRDPVK